MMHPMRCVAFPLYCLATAFREVFTAMTQQTDPTVPPSEEKRPVPAWMGIVVVLLCLIGGGGFLYWYLHDPLASGEAVSDPDRTVAPTPRPTRSVVRSARVVDQGSVDGVKVASET